MTGEVAEDRLHDDPLFMLDATAHRSVLGRQMRPGTAGVVRVSFEDAPRTRLAEHAGAIEAGRIP
jgi:hypothetical protein